MKTNETEKPLAQRITQGAVTWETITHMNQEQTIMLADRREFARILGGIYGPMLPESLADASLIAEAFNTTHETGKTPAQLAAENVRLREALAEIVAVHDLDAFRTRKVMPMDTPLAAAAIAKARELLKP